MTDEDRVAIQQGFDSLQNLGSVPMEDILADFGLTLAEFEALPEFDSEDPETLQSRDREGAVAVPQ